MGMQIRLFAVLATLLLGLAFSAPQAEAGEQNVRSGQWVEIVVSCMIWHDTDCTIPAFMVIGYMEYPPRIGEMQEFFVGRELRRERVVNLIREPFNGNTGDVVLLVILESAEGLL